MTAVATSNAMEFKRLYSAVVGQPSPASSTNPTSVDLLAELTVAMAGPTVVQKGLVDGECELGRGPLFDPVYPINLI